MKSNFHFLFACSEQTTNTKPNTRDETTSQKKWHALEATDFSLTHSDCVKIFKAGEIWKKRKGFAVLGNLFLLSASEQRKETAQILGSNEHERLQAT